MTDWQRDNDPSGKLLLRAGLCQLWRKRALVMTRDELLVFVGFLDELATARAVPDLTILTREQLEQRRNDVHVQLAALNDRLHAIGATRKGDLEAGRLEPLDDGLRHCGQVFAASPLEPSDPSA